MNILDLLRADGSIVVNKKLAHEIGLEATVVYSELVSLYQYWSNRGELVDDNKEKTDQAKWFFATIENLEENTCLKRFRQDKAIKYLKEIGLIETKQMGIPKKRYFSITEKINDFIGTHKNVGNQHSGSGGDSEDQNAENPRHSNSVGNQHSGMLESNTQECWNQTTNNTRTNNTRINNTKLNNQSIRKKIQGSNFGEKLQGWLMKNQDRLTDDYLESISEFHQLDLLTETQFIGVLSNVFQQKQIRDFSAYLRRSYYGKVEEGSHPENQEVHNTENTKDIIPKWMEQKYAEGSSEVSEDSRKTFESMLAEREKRKAQAVDQFLNE